MKTIRTLLAALLLSAGAAPVLAEAPSTTEATLAANTVKAEVNGMVCDFCAQAVEKVFRKEDGVTDVAVDLDNGAITITLEDGATITDERVAKLVKKSGYDLVAIRRGEA